MIGFQTEGPMSELAFQSAGEIAEAIRSGRVSAREAAKRADETCDYVAPLGFAD